MTGDTIARIGLVTVSDRASRSEYEDRSGPALRAYFEEVLTSPWQAEVRLVSDDRASIESTLKSLSDEVGCCLVVTSGGTGPTARDCTPEATAAVCRILLPGFGERMRAVSCEHVPTAILSRQTAGIRGRTLIVNLPGQPRAIRECLDAVLPAIPHAIELLGGLRVTTRTTGEG
jgi:molybdopterin adenylyltransferase